MKRFAIVATCDPHNAKFHYKVQKVLKYDHNTPIAWVMADSDDIEELKKTMLKWVDDKDLEPHLVIQDEKDCISYIETFSKVMLGYVDKEIIEERYENLLSAFAESGPGIYQKKGTKYFLVISISDDYYVYNEDVMTYSIEKMYEEEDNIISENIGEKYEELRDYFIAMLSEAISGGGDEEWWKDVEFNELAKENNALEEIWGTRYKLGEGIKLPSCKILYNEDTEWDFEQAWTAAKQMYFEDKEENFEAIESISDFIDYLVEYEITEPADARKLYNSLSDRQKKRLRLVENAYRVDNEYEHDRNDFVYDYDDLGYALGMNDLCIYCCNNSAQYIWFIEERLKEYAHDESEVEKEIDFLDSLDSVGGLPAEYAIKCTYYYGEDDFVFNYVEDSIERRIREKRNNINLY